MSSRRLRDAIRTLSTLGEPQRLRLYEFVAESSEPVTKDKAAAALGIKRGIAAFHLDKLVDAGLLAVEFRRLDGRSGPGAGRPSKLYRRSSNEIAASAPERHYDTAARLLADGIELAATEGVSATEGVNQAAAAYGEELAAALTKGQGPVTIGDVCALIEDHGYEPAESPNGIVLRNCPFHRLAQRHTDLVCTMNLAIFQALDAATADVDLEPRLEPEPGHCCVKLLNEDEKRD